MYNWFSVYQGNTWDPSRHKYSQEFVNTVLMIRNWFRLNNYEPYHDIGSECIRGYFGKFADRSEGVKEDKRLVEVFVNEFIYDGYFLENGAALIRFVLDIQIRWFRTGNVFCDDELLIEFPRLYRKAPPQFWLKKYMQYGGSHPHHTIGGGRLCVLTEGEDWGDGDTIISAINVALNRIVEHAIDYPE